MNGTFAEFSVAYGFGDDPGQILDTFAALHSTVIDGITAELDGVPLDESRRSALSVSHRLLCEALRLYRVQHDGSQ